MFEASVAVNGSQNGLWTHLAVLYIDSVLLDALHCWVQLLHRFHPVHLLSLNQSLPSKPRPTEKHTQTHTCYRQYIHTHSTSTRGQRMNNAEVVSEWKSPPLFPSFSPSPSNKEAMLPWRQWSLGTPSANYSLPCVKHGTNGCSNWCCCCHRHWDPIGWALLFDWISDLVFERKNISRSATCVPTHKICLFFPQNEKDYFVRGKCFCFRGLRDLNSVPFLVL